MKQNIMAMTKFKVGAYTQGAYTQSQQKATSCKKQTNTYVGVQIKTQQDFEILLVEIKIGISAGRTLNLASTDCSFNFYKEKSLSRW